MTQPSLFPALVPSPALFHLPGCPGLAVLGPEVQHEGCVNQTLTCQSCPAVGEVSRRAA